MPLSMDPENDRAESEDRYPVTFHQLDKMHTVIRELHSIVYVQGTERLSDRGSGWDDESSQASLSRAAKRMNELLEELGWEESK